MISLLLSGIPLVSELPSGIRAEKTVLRRHSLHLFI